VPPSPSVPATPRANHTERYYRSRQPSCSSISCPMPGCTYGRHVETFAPANEKEKIKALLARARAHTHTKAQSTYSVYPCQISTSFDIARPIIIYRLINHPGLMHSARVR
jgi:hypothetical protein